MQKLLFPTKKIMKSKQLFNVLLLLFLIHTLYATTPQELFVAANDAYTKGQYTQAIEGYESILASGQISKEVYFNLGNAYWKNKQKAKAILHFERALLLSPKDEDTAYNLAIVQSQLEDDLDVVGTFFLKDWWQNFHHFFSSTTWSILTLLGLWSGIGGLAIWLLAEDRQRKKKGFFAGLGLLMTSLLFFFAARSQGNFEQHSQQAIVLESAISLRNGPDEKSTNLLTIHEGLKVELLDKIGDWYKVKLSNGEQGWLPNTAIEEI